MTPNNDNFTAFVNLLFLISMCTLIGFALGYAAIGAAVGFGLALLVQLI
jgi:hypothetical protein